MLENEFILSWLRNAISMTTVSVDTDPSAAGQEPEKPDPRFRKLHEGILYSKRLAVTYYLAIITFILIVSALHWFHHLTRSRRRRISGLRQGGIYSPDVSIRRTEGKPNEASSSRSSTIGGALNPPPKTPTEYTSLLRNHHQLQISSSTRTSLSPVKAILIYQPRPIPFFNKTLPSNGSSLLIMAFIGLNIFYILFHINFTIFELFVFADRCGLMFVTNLPLLYILAAKTQPLSALTGYSHESLNIYHRRLGEVMCLEALLHGIGMFGVWYTVLEPNGMTFIWFLTEKVIVLGLLTFIAYQSLYFTSLTSFRQRWYELFLGLHIVLQILALGFVFFHHPGIEIYVGTTLAIFLIDRLVYRLGFKSTTVEATIRILEDGDTVKLSCHIPIRTSPLLFIGKSINSGWSASEHIFITVPSLARKHLFQAHPFTIASPAPTTNHEDASLDLIIRVHDGFSADLLRKARTHNTLNIRLNGPYGSSHAVSLLEDADLAIVIAGGSGVTVAWPLLNHLLHISSEDAETAIGLPCRQNIVFVWIIRQESHISWIGKQALEDMRIRGVRVIVSDATEIIGRPDLKTMLESIVEDFGGERIGVVASGPDEMGRTVRNTCAGLAWKGRDIGVTIEKFSW